MLLRKTHVFVLIPGVLFVSAEIDKFHRSRKRPIRIAICAVGHFRTFIVPGILESWKTNVLRNDEHVVTDLIIIGHLGNSGASASAKRIGSNKANIASGANDTRLLNVLAAAKPWTRHVEIHTDGNCREYLEVMGKSGHVFCTNYKIYIMMAWYNHCYHKYESFGERYDLFVHTRPDIGVLRPVQWERISRTAITYQLLRGARALDWFYVVPAQVLPSYWATVLEIYSRKGGCQKTGEDLCMGRGLPDYTIFATGASCFCSVLTRPGRASLATVDHGIDRGNWCGPEACKKIHSYNFSRVWEDILGIHIPMRSAAEVNCSQLMPLQGSYCNACRQLVTHPNCAFLKKKWCQSDWMVSHREKCHL